MNTSINITNSSPQKSNDPVASSTVKLAKEGGKSTETGDLAASSKSFHESIQKAYDESKSTTQADNAAKSDDKLSGNGSPESDEFPEITANDDRSLLADNLYLSGQLSTEDTAIAETDTLTQPLTQTQDQLPGQPLTQSLSAETNIDGEPDGKLSLLSASTPLLGEKVANTDVRLTGGKGGEMSSQLRQLFTAEASAVSGSGTKKSLSASAGNTTAATSNVDGVITKQGEVVTLKTELAGMTGDKAQVLLNTANPQQLLSNVQTSQLLQSATAQTSGAENLAQITSAPTNSFSTTNLSSALPPAGITEAFGRPAWAQGMGKQVLMMVNQNISTAEIRLNPAHLGPIEVLIDMSEEQVSVSMNSRHAVVREAMEQALPKLREMLEENGFSLADTDISKRSFAEQREQNSENNQKGTAAGNFNEAATSEINGQVMQQTNLSRSMVDYYI